MQTGKEVKIVDSVITNGFYRLSAARIFMGTMKLES